MSTLSTDCPEFVIHLDYPPEKRWNHVIKYFKDIIPKAKEISIQFLGQDVVNVVIPMFNIAFCSDNIIYKEELIAIANQINIDVGELLLLQLVYEAFACCTSVIVRGEKHPIHIRNMNWNLPILRDLTFQAKYKIKNKTVFTGTSWAGYIGVLTGMRNKLNKNEESYSISVNYRESPESYKIPYAGYLRNIYRTLKGYWPIGYLVREVLTYDTTYQRAVESFQTAQLISPIYISMCGEKNTQGSIITRNRDVCEPMYIKHLAFSTNLIQANIDHFNDKEYKVKKNNKHSRNIIDSKYRYSYVDLALNTHRTQTIENLYKMMSLSPCFSYSTIYTSIMVPKSKYYKTLVKRNRELYKKAIRQFSTTVQYAKKF